GCRLNGFDFGQILGRGGRRRDILELIDLLADLRHLPAEVIEPFFQLLHALLDRLLRCEGRDNGETDQQKYEPTTGGHGFLLFVVGEREKGLRRRRSSGGEGGDDARR